MKIYIIVKEYGVSGSSDGDTNILYKIISVYFNRKEALKELDKLNNRVSDIYFSGSFVLLTETTRDLLTIKTIINYILYLIKLLFKGDE